MTNTCKEALVFAAMSLALLGHGCATPTQGTRAVARVDPPGTAGQGDPSADEMRANRVSGELQDFLRRTEHYAQSYADQPNVPTDRAAAAPAPGGTPTGLAIGSLASRIDTPSPDLAPDSVANLQVSLPAQPTPQTAPTPQATPTPPPPALPVIQAVAIRADRPEATRPSEPARTSASNEPLDARPPSARMSFDAFLDDLAAQAADSDDFNVHWQYELARLAFNPDDAPSEGRAHLSDGPRRLLTALSGAASAARTAALSPMRVDQGVLDQAADLPAVLREMADPVVANVALCRRVLTYGVYEEMSSTDFTAGHSINTIVYCEVRNFVSERTDDDRYRTLLGTRLTLMTPAGDTVWHREEPEIEDVCRNRRSDFFLAQRVAMPATIPAGDYVLKVEVEDKLSGRQNGTFLPMTIQSSLAATITP